MYPIDSTLNRRDVLRLGLWGAAGLAAAPVLAACGGRNGGAGKVSTTSEKLDPFVYGQSGKGSTGLPKRMAWANTTPIGIFAALGDGMSKAADQRGYDYLTADAQGDPQVNVDQINTFFSRGVGGLTIQPLNADAQTPLMDQALDKGVCVIGIITNPCIVQVAADQYNIGLQQGRDAATYIKEKLGGKATVFNGNLNQLAPELARRGEGVLTGLKEAGPGVTVIDTYTPPDIQTPDKVFSFIQTQLQRTPDIKVVLGVDGFVLPAYQAFQQTDKLTDDMYFSSIDGDPAAIALVAKGGPYRASLAFAWELLGYGMGQFIADWVEGKSVPRVMVANNTLVNSPAIATKFLADAADPASVFEDHDRYQTYVPLLGNVSYDQRKELAWRANYQLT